jgi:acyl-CoA thioester hydrolase
VSDSDAGIGAATTFRVRYPEIDRMGVAHHAAYFIWFEMGRTELMRKLGCSYRSVEDDLGLAFPVINAGASFLASARYDDWLEVRTKLSSAKGARVRFEYELYRRDGGSPLATGFTEHAVVNENGRPVRMPEELRKKLRGGECKE